MAEAVNKEVGDCPRRTSVQSQENECPVTSKESASSSPPSLFSSTPVGMAIKAMQGGCPMHKGDAVSGGSDGINPANREELHSQVPGPGQTKPLCTKRATSTIPRADYHPAHQPEGTSNWVYPSEQMYYNAMKRKGWDAQEEDMKAVVAIHNVVNEEGWRRVLEWEQEHKGQPRLKRFSGKAQDISPKAWLKSLIGYALPFDRHDWIIDRNGEDVRYVVDFYTGKPVEGKPASIYLDVRPALDSVGAVMDRFKMFMKQTFVESQKAGKKHEK